MSFGSAPDLEQEQHAVELLIDSYEKLNDIELDLPRVDLIDDIVSSLDNLNQSIEQYNELDFNLPCTDCVDAIETYATALESIAHSIEIINNTDLDAFQEKIDALSDTFKDFNQAVAPKAASIDKSLNALLKLNRAIKEFKALNADFNIFKSSEDSHHA